MEMVLNLALSALPATETSAVEKKSSDSKASESGNEAQTAASAGMDWAAIFNSTLLAASGSNAVAPSANQAVAQDTSLQTASAGAQPLPLLNVAQALGAQSGEGEVPDTFLSEAFNPSVLVASSGKDLLAGVLQQAKLNKDIQAFQITTKPLPDENQGDGALVLSTVKAQLGQAKNLNVERTAGRKTEDGPGKHQTALHELAAASDESVQERKQSQSLDKEIVLVKESALGENNRKSDVVQGLEAGLSAGQEQSFSRFDGDVKTSAQAQVAADVQDVAWVDSVRQQMDLAKLKNSDVLRVDVMLRDDQKLGLEANIKDGVLWVRFDAQTNMKDLLGDDAMKSMMAVMMESAPGVKEVRFEQKSFFEGFSNDKPAFSSSEHNGGRSSRDQREQATDRQTHSSALKPGVEVLNTPISSVKNALDGLEKGRTVWRA